jgi:hypothetical protein
LGKFHIYIVKLQVIFFYLHMKRKELILCTCDLTSDFLIHISWEKNDITHLQVYKWFFQFTREKGKWYSTLVELQFLKKNHLCENKIILHICESTSDFFNSHEKKENDIPHLWNYKFFLIFTYVKTKLYCTFASSQVNPYLETENKIELLSKTQSGLVKITTWNQARVWFWF